MIFYMKPMSSALGTYSSFLAHLLHVPQVRCPSLFINFPRTYFMFSCHYVCNPRSSTQLKSLCGPFTPFFSSIQILLSIS